MGTSPRKLKNRQWHIVSRLSPALTYYITEHHLKVDIPFQPLKSCVKIKGNTRPGWHHSVQHYLGIRVHQRLFTTFQHYCPVQSQQSLCTPYRSLCQTSFHCAPAGRQNTESCPLPIWKTIIIKFASHQYRYTKDTRGFWYTTNDKICPTANGDRKMLYTALTQPNITWSFRFNAIYCDRRRI